MVVSYGVHSICVVTIFILQYRSISGGLNLGLISGDNKRHGSPFFVRKSSHLSPIFINIHPKPPPILPMPPLPPFLPLIPPLPKLLPTLPKLPSRLPLVAPKLPKPPPSLNKALRKLRSPFSPLPLPPMLPPFIPKLPFLPILPPLLPSLPFSKPKILNTDRLLKKSALKPFKVSILKTPLERKLQKALGSELKPVILPCPTDKKDLLGKLRDLRKQGYLTTVEFTKFKKLLLKKK